MPHFSIEVDIESLKKSSVVMTEIRSSPALYFFGRDVSNQISVSLTVRVPGEQVLIFFPLPVFSGDGSGIV